jgi:hypothetical protein
MAIDDSVREIETSSNNLRAYLQAIDGGTLRDIAEKIRGGQPGIPDYSKVASDPALQQEIKDIIKNTYDITGPNSIYHGMLDFSGVDPRQATMMKKIISEQLYPHVPALMNSIGSKNFERSLYEIMMSSQRQKDESIARWSSSQLMEEYPNKDIDGWIRRNYGLNDASGNLEAKYSIDLIGANRQGIVNAYYTPGVSGDQIKQIVTKK